MTYEEIAVYVDTKARLLFPAMFIIFNICYWILVYQEDSHHFISSLYLT